jgi:long-chain acyl-CoA synthetase
VHLSYLPLPHVFEQLNQMVVTAYGGRIGYYQGDTLKILDDLTALRPTFFPSVPRLLSRIYDKVRLLIGCLRRFNGVNRLFL